MIDLETWRLAGPVLVHNHSAVQWALGDWLNAGQEHHAPAHLEARKITGYDVATLELFARVSAAFDPQRRRAGLSFAHHAEVAHLAEAERDGWLDTALAEGLPAHRLRNRVKAALAEVAA